MATCDCKHCWIWQYDEKTGGIEKDGRGNDQKRLPKLGPPCTRSKCQKGTIDKQRSLSKRNEAAYAHYLECRAVGKFPDDPLVRATARTIYAFEQREQKKTAMLLESFITVMATKQ